MASKYALKKSMRPRSRNDAKGMSPKELEDSTSSPDGEYVKKIQGGGPTSRSTRDRRYDQFIDDERAITKKFAERGSSGAAEAQKQISTVYTKAVDDMENVERYGKDAPKGRSFGQKTRPKPGKVKVKKMASGGNVCRGMGAATRGGNFRMG